MQGLEGRAAAVPDPCKSRWLLTALSKTHLFIPKQGHHAPNCHAAELNAGNEAGAESRESCPGAYEEAAPGVLLKCWLLALLCPSKRPPGANREGGFVLKLLIGASQQRFPEPPLLRCIAARLCTFTGTVLGSRFLWGFYMGVCGFSV